MSMTKNNAIRCDGCGKLSRHPLGEYRRPDGSAGYINSQGRDSRFDYCEECEEGRCPWCGSEEVVKTTPISPGPVGWGGRCQACAEKWTQPVDSPPPVEADDEWVKTKAAVEKVNDWIEASPPRGI